MSRLGRLARLDVSDRQLLVEAAVAVPMVRIGLTLLPFRIAHRGITAATRWLRRAAPTIPRDPERVAWAVRTVAARVPRASCLTQALAANLLLVRHGYSPTLRVGVAKNDDGTLRAHAWLECGGASILGEPAPGTFVPFPPIALS